jgi:Kef-type K+ transport system membrane component KefB
MSFALGTPEWFSVRSVGFVGIAAMRSIIAYAVVVVLTLGLHLHVVPRLLAFLTAMEQVHHSPLLLLGVVSVCLFMALFTELIGLSLECGAFLAGLAFVNVSRDAQGAFTSIRVMENLFGSMFFACVGMILNPMFLLKNAGEILSMVILIVVIKACSMTVVMAANRVVSIDKALLAGVGLCQVGELALIFIIKAHATKLVSRRIYLLFVAAIAVFLGCSSIFNRQVVLARRKKTVFRLPTIMARRSKAHAPNGATGGQLTHGEEERNRGHSDASGPLSPPATPRERRAMHKTTPSMGVH